MKITDVRVKLPKNKREDSVLLAVASITIDNCFVVHDVKVIKGDSELYLGMPSKKHVDASGNQTHKDIAHALNNETREMIKKAVIDAYNVEITKNTEEN